MKSKRIKSIVATVMASAILCASVPEMGVNAASMTRTMNWVTISGKAAVTITNSWSDVCNYTNSNNLCVYSKKDCSGTLLTGQVAGETYAVANNTIINNKMKSARAKHYALKNGVVYKQYIYYRNKGEGYKY